MMKKLLLFRPIALLFALLFCLGSRAETITFTSSQLGGSTTDKYELREGTADGVIYKAYSFTYSGSTSTSFQFNGGKNSNVAFYNVDPIPGKITSVKITKASGTDRKGTVYVSTESFSVAANGTSKGQQSVTEAGTTWNIDGNYSYLLFTVDVSNALYVSKIEVTYEAAEISTVATPTFSVAGGMVDAGTQVSVSCSTGDATVYVATATSLNGAEPTAENVFSAGTEYTTPFTVNATETYYAVAVDVEENYSGVANVTYTVLNLEHAGTAADPFSVADARAYAESVGTTATTGDFYVCGYVVNVDEFSTQYGNATWKIADDADDNENVFVVYRCKNIGGEAFTAADQNNVKVGDMIVAKGKIVNHKGNTPEFSAGCELVSVEKPAVPAIVNITIDGELTTTQYVYGSKLSYDGLSVMGEEENGDIKAVNCVWSNNAEDGDNGLTTLGQQTVTITATYADGIFDTTTATITVVDQAKAITLSGDYKTNYFIGEAFSTNGLVVTVENASGSEDIYEGEDLEMLTISEPNMTQEGVKTITVSIDGISASYTITVIDPNPKEYVLVENINELLNGEEFIISHYYAGTKNYAKDIQYAIGAWDAYNNRFNTVEVDKPVNNVISNPTGIITLTLEAAGDGKYYVKTSEGQYIGHTGNRNTTSVSETPEDAYKATVTIDDDNQMTIQFSDNYKLQAYVNQSGNDILSHYFNCYTSNQKAFSAYKRVTHWYSHKGAVDGDDYELGENEIAIHNTTGNYVANHINLSTIEDYSLPVNEVLAKEVTFLRDVTKSNTWAAICLPFAVPADKLDGYDVITISGVNTVAGSVEFTFLGEDEGIADHTPYLIRKANAGEEAGQININFTNEDGIAVKAPKTEGDHESTVEGVARLVGVYTPTVVPQGCFALKNGVFMQPAEGNTNKLGAFRAYLDLNAPAGVSYKIVVKNQEEDGIEAIEAEQMEDGVFYNLMGQPVSNPTKGMYIFNGVKVIIK